MNPQPQIFTQAEQAIKQAQIKLNLFANALQQQQIDPANESTYQTLSSAIWTADGTLKACRDMQNAASPDALYDALRKLDAAALGARHRLDALRQAP